MTNWNPMSAAPITDRIDILAKRWISKTDDFEYRRFSDCFWRGTHFSGVPKEWHPVYWLPAPEFPTADIEKHEIGTEHRLRWQRNPPQMETS